jgi:DNA-binding transcriptional ArsR family regulator
MRAPLEISQRRGKLRCRGTGHPIQMKILRCLEEGGRSVGAILAEVGGSQANVSKHLAVLRRAGLAAARRDGASVHYRIADPRVLQIRDSVCRCLGERLDREREVVRGALAAGRGKG